MPLTKVNTKVNSGAKALARRGRPPAGKLQMHIGYNWVDRKWEVYVVNYHEDGEDVKVLFDHDEEEPCHEWKRTVRRNV